MHHHLKGIIYWAVAITVVFFAGCQKTSGPLNALDEDFYPIRYQSSSDIQRPLGDPTSKEYILSPGDTIDVKFFYTPDLNETQDVRPDGKIALQIIGEVSAAGNTPSQLRGLLKRLYASHLKDPEITVVVRSFSNQRVYVGGQVMEPGTLEMTGRMTALDAIMEAGGIDYREGEPRNVVVIRHYKGNRYGYLLNMAPVLEGKESQPFFLEPKDIVYIPRTEIAKVNQWVDQHFNKIIPQTGFVFTQRRGNTTIGIDTSGRY